jgi:hypothetical protein
MFEFVCSAKRTEERTWIWLVIPQREERLHVEPDRSGLGDWDTLPVESIATPADLASACLFLRRPTRDPHVATALLAVVAVALEFADQI